MYAYTATSCRSIANASEALPGETVSETLPQSFLDALAAAEALKETNKRDIYTKLEQSSADIQAFLQLTNNTVTLLQAVQQLKVQGRAFRRLHRLVATKLDGSD